MAQITIDGKGNANAHLKKVAGGYREVGAAAKTAAKAAGDTEAAIERAEKKAERRIRKRAGDLREVTAGGFGGDAFGGVGAFAAAGAAGLAAYAASRGIQAFIGSLDRTQEVATSAAIAVRGVAEESRKRQDADADAAFTKIASMSVNDQHAAIAKDPRMADVIARALAAKKSIDASEASRLPSLAAEGTERALERIRRPNGEIADEQIRSQRSGIAALEEKGMQENTIKALLRDILHYGTLGIAGQGSDATVAANARKSFEETANSMRRAAASLDRASARTANLPGN